jgi:nitrogen-specific signal transduction histidine kinase
MKTAALIKSPATGSVSLSGRLKIFLMVTAFIIIACTLWYTHDLVQALSKKEKEVADLYAKSLEYFANSKAGDYNFFLTEIINTIDFPIVLTDRNNEPEFPYDKSIKNISLDPLASREEQHRFMLSLMNEMDRSHPPIKVAYQDTIILSYLHYGESSLIVQLRWLPYVELAVAALFILIGYISFSYIKRSEQSNIWVGMARETAHQLGTPISSMLGWVELLKEQSLGDKKATETLLDMESDLHRLQKIADRFSKIGSKPDLHEENLNEVIGKVTQYFQRRIPQTGKKVHLIIESIQPVRAQINRELFEWVIENLTKNALDAIENGDGTIAFSISEERKYAFVDISDTGKGITPKHRNDVFRPGFSTKKRGWGLGLSLSKRIIETYHAGRLFLKENNSGFKTTFRIKLIK